MCAVSDEQKERRVRSRHLPLAAPLYHAGEWVPAGVYEDVETHRIVRLDEKDMLPPSFDGRVACYIRGEPEPTEKSGCRNCGKCRRAAGTVSEEADV
jgi:hypothetical protein